MITTLCESTKLDPFSFQHNFGKYCPISIILSLFQTEIICPKTHNWISHFAYNLLLHYLERCNHIHFFTKKLLNRSAVHAVNLWLLQSRKLWWCLLLTSSMLLHDVIMTSYCFQRYAQCLVTTLFQQDSAPTHRGARATVELMRQETPNIPAPNLWPPTNPDLSPMDCEIWAVMQHRVYHRQIHRWMNWNGGSSMSGAILNNRFLTRLLTSGKEDIERVSMLKEYIVTMLILSIFVTSNPMQLLQL